MSMRILFVHDVIGDLGGAEANVRHAANGLLARDCETALLHGPSTGTGVEKFHACFDNRFDWSADGQATALQRALDWQPDVIYVHKLKELIVLEGLVAARRPLVRMVHDHDMYCQRSYRYMPWNRKICSRKAGLGCMLTCGLVRNREGPLPVRIAWVGNKLRELKLCRQFDRHIVVTQFMQQELELHDFPAERISILPPVPRPAAASYQPTYAEPTVLFVGQLLRGKGCDLFIRSLKHISLPQWRA